MQKAVVRLAIVSTVLLSGCETLDTGLRTLDGLLAPQELTTETIVAGLKEALRVGTDRSVKALSQSGGYFDNQLLRVKVPEKLEPVTNALRKVGLSSQIDTFEKKMNEAAERAASKAIPVFGNAIREMSFEDAKALLSGGDTAITDYFREKTRDDLTALYKPVVTRTMADVGAARAYHSLISKYNALPLTRKPDVSLESYVTGKALDGLFLRLAEMEQDIRENPAARTSALLRRVFGSTGRQAATK